MVALISQVEERGKFARLDFDVSTITWNRVVDINDRGITKFRTGEPGLFR